MLIKHEANPLLNWFLKKQKEPNVAAITRIHKQFEGKYRDGQQLRFDTTAGVFLFGEEFEVYGYYAGMGSDDGIRGIIEKLKASLAFMLAVEGNKP